MAGLIPVINMGALDTSIIGRRRDSRLRVEVPARLTTVTGIAQVSLCDLSQSGCRMRVPESLRDGQDGMLSWLDFEAFGKLVWVRSGFAGMEFDALQPPEALLETRDRFDVSDFMTEDQIAKKRAQSWYKGYK